MRVRNDASGLGVSFSLRCARMNADVIIVGTGTAGAAAALACAKRGLSVLAVDRRPLDLAGARWVNGVASWMFGEAEVALPEGDELVGGGHSFHMVAGWGPRRVVMRDHGVLEVDMRKLVARLQREAEAAGARFLGEVSVTAFDGKQLETSSGPLRGKYFVDASGLSGAGLLHQPAVGRHDLCAAAQEVRHVKDLEAARDFFASHGTPEGDTLCFTGIAGGYSIINLRLEGETIGLLTGSIPAEGHPSGRELLDRFVEDHAFIGERIFGGSRAIPLRRPYERLGRDNVALLGDAACQVFSAHGSGIGIGLIAARMLAEALSDGRGPHGYAVAFHRRYGALLATYELFRRLSQTLAVEDIEAMMEAGLMDEGTIGAGLGQRLPKVTPELALSKLKASAKAPRLALRLGAALGRASLAGALYSQCPSDPRSFERWAGGVRKLMA